LTLFVKQNFAQKIRKFFPFFVFAKSKNFCYNLLVRNEGKEKPTKKNFFKKIKNLLTKQKNHDIINIEKGTRKGH